MKTCNILTNLLLLLLISSLMSLTVSKPAFSQNNPLSLQLANTYKANKSLNISEYLVSEKLDGVRARWTGKHLLTRQGRIINAPENFTHGWPEVQIDGELWMGRGTFDQLSGIVRRHKPALKNWAAIRFMMFDLPMNKQVFSKRYRELIRLKSVTNSLFLDVVKQWHISSLLALEQQLVDVTNENGEGLMLHHESALYQSGRSEHLLKVKKHSDSEAVVIDYIEGKGKYVGKMGALVVTTSAGITFRIGSGFTDQQRMTPPPIGCTITFKYFGKTSNGVPRFASFMRIKNTL